MNTTHTPNTSPRDASLRVSKATRDSLKAAAAVMGRPLYDITNEAIEKYLDKIKLSDPIGTIRKRRKTATAALLVLLLSLFAMPAFAGDAVQVVQGTTVYDFDGVLLDRLENGDTGSIEFGAYTVGVHHATPKASQGDTYVGDYDVTVHPAPGMQGFNAEHCRRGFARYNSVSGTTYIRLVCPAS